MEIKGITGKMLYIDLGTGDIRVEKTPTAAIAGFLGGRGLGAYIFSREVPFAVDPLAPGNQLIFTNGPMAGTMAPGNNKVNVTFKSPLTKTYSYSLCGGHWGPELKFAGYDALIIKGKSPRPVYLLIEDEKVEIRPAQHLWGRLIPETDIIIKQELGDHFIKVACIGPAGEKLNRMACITTEWFREFGRGGAGAVMGSKNLKAIVVRGTGEVAVARPGEMAQLAEEAIKALRRHSTAAARRKYGTAEMVEGINYLGFWSTRNFSEGSFEKAVNVSGPVMRELVVKDAACYACPVACGKRTSIDTSEYGRIEIEGPEFETIGLLGANCGVGDWEYLIKATQICDNFGMDTMACGATVSMVMEAFELGRISPQQLDGIKPGFGDGKTLVELLVRIGERKGIGDLLAEGVKTAAEKLGVADLAMHVKGMPLSTYDPRGCKGMAITYGTSPKGAHHMVAPTMGPEIAGDRLSVEGKGALVRGVQLKMAVIDSLVLCSSMNFGIPLEKQLAIYRAVTGLELSEEEIMRTGERILNLERMFGVQMGLNRRDDYLPGRFLSQSIKDGYSQGHVVEMDVLLDDYYSVMGWDQNGVPSDAKTKELGLDEEITAWHHRA